LVEKRIENDEIKEKLEEKEVLVKNLENKLQQVELMEKTHIAAFEVSERWNKGQKAELIKEYNDVVDLLDEADDIIKDRDSQIKNLKKDLKEKSEMLDEADEQKEELKRQLYLFNKSLPSLPKKQSKFKQFKTKAKAKFQQFIERAKTQKQELIELNKHERIRLYYFRFGTVKQQRNLLVL